MRINRLRLVAAWLALSVVIGLPSATEAAGGKVTLVVPNNVTPGIVTTVTLKLPKSVAAVDGRILVQPGSADLIGVAPAGKGTALSPVRVDGGFAFGVYGMKAKGGKQTVRLVLVPNITGDLGVRVLIDALSGKTGNRLYTTTNELTGTVRVTGRNTSITAPAGHARGAPNRTAGAVRTVFGRPTISTDDADIVRAAWYRTRGLGTECTPGHGRDGRRQQRRLRRYRRSAGNHRGPGRQAQGRQQPITRAGLRSGRQQPDRAHSGTHLHRRQHGRHARRDAWQRHLCRFDRSVHAARRAN